MSLELLNNDRTIIIVGRGHSATRIISNSLAQSGIYMGKTNPMGDMIPGGSMYEAAKIFSGYVSYKDGLEWDFSTALNMDPTEEYKTHLTQYLRPLFGKSMNVKGWKIPEALLSLPWIVKLFPNARYVFWIRNPLYILYGDHGTDKLSLWDIPCNKEAPGVVLRRIESVKYQYDILNATPKPKNHVFVDCDKFIDQDEETLSRLSKLVGKNIEPPDNINRGKVDRARWMDHLVSLAREFGYY